MTSTPMLSYAFRAPRVRGLDHHTQGLLDELVAQWLRHLPRNVQRMVYLNAKNEFDDLGVSLPPSLVDKVDVVVGWPEKAVYEVANRIVFERVQATDGGDPFDLRPLLRANRFKVEFPQAVVSSLAQSCVFVSTTPGDTTAGEPDALVMFHSALWATGLWDRRRRALKAHLLISDTDPAGNPTVMTIGLPSQHVVCVKGPAGWYVDDVIPNIIGRPTMEVLPFRPSTDRPFGRSRIDRTVISLTNRAVRQGARQEIHAELFTSMKLLLMGVDDDAFTDNQGNKIPLWSFFLGRANTIGKDEDGDVPKLETITAESPEPHIALGRDLAAKFSGHTGVPLSSLGIATDNPESADAKQAAREDIINDVEKQHIIYEDALLRTFENAVMIRDGLSVPPPEMADLTFSWRRADRPSLVSIADAGTKQVASIPDLADTEVGMELIGLSPDQIDRAQSELRRKAGAQVLAGIRDQTQQPAEDSAAVKAKADAMGVLIRSGVEPAEAAERVGFSGLFTGAVPTSLRLPESDAAVLEG